MKYLFIYFLTNSALRNGLLVATIIQISQNLVDYKLISYVTAKLVAYYAIFIGNHANLQVLL